MSPTRAMRLAGLRVYRVPSADPGAAVRSTHQYNNAHTAHTHVDIYI